MTILVNRVRQLASRLWLQSENAQYSERGAQLDRIARACIEHRRRDPAEISIRQPLRPARNGGAPRPAPRNCLLMRAPEKEIRGDARFPRLAAFSPVVRRSGLVQVGD